MWVKILTMVCYCPVPLNGDNVTMVIFIENFDSTVVLFSSQ